MGEWAQNWGGEGGGQEAPSLLLGRLGKWAHGGERPQLAGQGQLVNEVGEEKGHSLPPPLLNLPSWT